MPVRSRSLLQRQSAVGSGTLSIFFSLASSGVAKRRLGSLNLIMSQVFVQWAFGAGGFVLGYGSRSWEGLRYQLLMLGCRGFRRRCEAALAQGLS